MAVTLKKEFWNGSEYKTISKIVFTSPNFNSPAVVGTRSHMQPGAKYMGTWYESVDWMYRQKYTQDYTNYPSEMESFFGRLTLLDDFDFDNDLMATYTHNYKSTYTVQPTIDYIYKDKNNYCKVSSSTSFATSSGISIRFDYPVSTDRLFVNKSNSIWWTCSGIGSLEKLDLYITYNGVSEVCIASGIINSGKYSFNPTTTASGTAKLRLNYFDCYTVYSNSFYIVNEVITPAVPATPSIPERLAKPEVLYKPAIPAIPEIPAIPPPANRLLTIKKIDDVYNKITEFVGPMYYDSETDTIYRFEAYGIFYFSKALNMWKCLDPTPLGIGKGAAILKSGSQIYVITGRIKDTVTNQAGVMISNRRNLFLRYNIDIDEWVMLRPPLDTEQSIGTFLHKSSLYKFDDETDYIYYRSAKGDNIILYRYDIIRDEWSEYCNFPVNSTANVWTSYGDVIFKHNGKLIVISTNIKYSAGSTFPVGKFGVTEIGSINSSRQYEKLSDGLSTDNSIVPPVAATNKTEVMFITGAMLQSNNVDGTYAFTIHLRCGHIGSEVVETILGKIVLTNGIVSMQASTEYQSFKSIPTETAYGIVTDSKFFYVTQNKGTCMYRVLPLMNNLLPGCNYFLRRGYLVLFNDLLYSIGFGYSETMSVLDISVPNAEWSFIGESPFAPVTDIKYTYLFRNANSIPYVIPDHDNLCIYVVLDTVFMMFNTISNEWTTLAYMPFSVDKNFSAVKVGTVIYALRGTDSSTFWKYDTITNTWSTLDAFNAINIQYPVLSYDRQGSYGVQTTELSAGMFDSTIVRASLIDLIPDTNYRFRLVGRDSDGLKFGVELLFKTKPLVMLNSIESITFTTITYLGTLFPDGKGVVTYFEYGVGNTFTYKTSELYFSTSEVIPIQDVVSNLLPNTTYCCRLVGKIGNIYTYSETKIIKTLYRVITSSPTNITPYTMTIHGLVLPYINYDTEAYFHYGSTTLYGSTTEHKSVSYNVVDPDFSETFTGLIPDSIYHYRIAMTSPDGMLYGEDYEIRVPAIVSVEAVTSKTAFTATLSGVVYPMGTENTYRFRYKKYDGDFIDLANNYSNSNSVVTLSTDLDDLFPNTIYNYQLLTTTLSGTYYSNTLVFKTDSFVVTEQASNTTSLSTTLSGVITPLSLNTIGYFEYRSTTVSGWNSTASLLLDYPGTNYLSTNIDNLEPDTSYEYRAVGTILTDTTASGYVYDYVYGDSLNFKTNSRLLQLNVYDIAPFSSTISGSLLTDAIIDEYNMEYWNSNDNNIITTPIENFLGPVEKNIYHACNELLPNTEYRYRIASNTLASGIKYSNIGLVYTTSDIVTSTVSGISYDKAILYGECLNTSSEIVCLFEYNIDEGLSINTDFIVNPNGVYYTTISGLQPNTVCRYRAVQTTIDSINATVSGTTLSGCSYGKYKEFTTLNNVVTDSGIYNSSFLNFTGRVRSTVSGTVGYFEYGVDNFNTLSSIIEVPYNDDYSVIATSVSGISSDLRYQYRLAYTTLSGVNATVSGTTISGSVYGETKYCYTNSDVVVDLASVLTSQTAYLSGYIKTIDDVVNPMLGYFEYGVNTFDKHTVYEDLIPDYTHFISTTISGLEANTTYKYRLVSATISGSSYSEVLTFKTKDLLYVPEYEECDYRSTTLSGSILGSYTESSSYIEYNSSTVSGIKTVGTVAYNLPVDSITVCLDDLTTETEYSYKLVNKYGKYYPLIDTMEEEVFESDIQKFTTKSVVKVKEVTDIKPYSSVLHGLITTYENYTSCYFVYGKDEAYDKTTSQQIVNTGDDIPVEEYIEDLYADSIYNCRFVRTTVSGVVFSKPFTFYTKAIVHTETAGECSPFRTTLSGIVTPNKKETTYYFEYGDVRDTLYGFNSYDPRVYKYAISKNQWTMISGVLNDFLGELKPWYFVDDGNIYLNSNNTDYYIESGKSHNVIKYDPITDTVNGHDLLPASLMGAVYNKADRLVYTVSGIDTISFIHTYSYDLHYNLIPGIPAIPGTPAIPEIPYQAAITYSPEIPGTSEIPSYSNYFTKLTPPNTWEAAPSYTTGKRVLNLSVSFSEVTGSGIVQAGTPMFHQYSNISVSGTCIRPQPRWQHGENSIIFTCSFGEGYSCFLTAWDDETHSTTNNKILTGEHYRVDAVAYRSNIASAAHKPTFNSSRCLVYPPGNDVILKGNDKFYGKFDLIYSVISGEYGEYLCFIPRMVGIDDSFVACAYDFVTTLHYQYT